MCAWKFHCESDIFRVEITKLLTLQGRYDMCCPMMSAWDLHKAWPEADFKVIPDAGHSANEPGIAAELVAATEKLKHIKKGQWEDIQKFVPENKQQSSRLGADSS
ncbi:hypothetical protein EV1_034656 [Malus domestica]